MLGVRRPDPSVHTCDLRYGRGDFSTLARVILPAYAFTWTRRIPDWSELKPLHKRSLLNYSRPDALSQLTTCKRENEIYLLNFFQGLNEFLLSADNRVPFNEHFPRKVVVNERVCRFFFLSFVVYRRDNDMNGRNVVIR